PAIRLEFVPGNVYEGIEGSLIHAVTGFLLNPADHGLTGGGYALILGDLHFDAPAHGVERQDGPLPGAFDNVPTEAGADRGRKIAVLLQIEERFFEGFFKLIDPDRTDKSAAVGGGLVFRIPAGQIFKATSVEEFAVEGLYAGFDGRFIGPVLGDAQEHVGHFHFSPGGSLIQDLDDMVAQAAADRLAVRSDRCLIGGGFHGVKSV